MALTRYEIAEMRYWRSVVANYFRPHVGGRITEVVDAILSGEAHQQDASDPEIEYPILRWRQLNERRN